MRSLAFLLGCVGAACGEGGTAVGPGEVDTTTVPIGVSWLGTYDGFADGTSDGLPLARLPIQLVVFVSQAPGCESTFAITVDSLFDRCALTFASPVVATFSYTTDSTRHDLRMERFSGGAIANTILGALRIDRLTAGQPAGRIVEATFTVIRR